MGSTTTEFDNSLMAGKTTVSAFQEHDAIGESAIQVTPSKTMESTTTDLDNNLKEDKLSLSAFEEHNAIGEAAITPSKTMESTTTSLQKTLMEDHITQKGFKHQAHQAHRRGLSMAQPSPLLPVAHYLLPEQQLILGMFKM